MTYSFLELSVEARLRAIIFSQNSPEADTYVTEHPGFLATTEGFGEMFNALGWRFTENGDRA